MDTLSTSRLTLKPFSYADFDWFATHMLTDPRVVEFYYSYKELTDITQVRDKAKTDFWDHFEESRNDYNLEIWAARETEGTDGLVGWCGLLHTELTDQYHGPELQYMLAGNHHGKGYATEMAKAAMGYAEDVLKLDSVIATVDIPNIASVKVLEKSDLDRVGQIEAYGSEDMYLYRKDFK